MIVKLWYTNVENAVTARFSVLTVRLCACDILTMVQKTVGGGKCEDEVKTKRDENTRTLCVLWREKIDKNVFFLGLKFRFRRKIPRVRECSMFFVKFLPKSIAFPRFFSVYVFVNCLIGETCELRESEVDFKVLSSHQFSLFRFYFATRWIRKNSITHISRLHFLLTFRWSFSGAGLLWFLCTTFTLLAVITQHARGSFSPWIIIVF